MQYQFTVPNGSYIVTLKFDEPKFTQVGQRVFNVLINGQTVLSNFDIFATAGALFQAVDMPIPVTVTTGQITIQFVTVVPNNTRLCALEIVAAPVAAPTLTSFNPSGGVAGNNVPVTLTGTNLATDVVINAGPNIAVSNVTVVSATQVTATFAIAAGTPAGPVNVTVTTEGGKTSPLPFTVNTSGPGLNSVSPSSGAVGSSVPVTLTGTNFVAGATVAVSNPGITVSGVTVVSATQITATFAIAANAATGAANVTVTTSGGTSGAVNFTVNAPAPTLTSVSPSSGAAGASVPVTLTGTNFITGATVAVSNPGVTVSGVTVVSATQITATFAIAANAATGAANVTVTTSGGTTGAATFTVNAAAPTLTSVSPSSGVVGNSVPVTLTGTNFIAGATVAVSNPNITVSGVTVVSATQPWSDRERGDGGERHADHRDLCHCRQCGYRRGQRDGDDQRRNHRRGDLHGQCAADVDFGKPVQRSRGQQCAGNA